MPRFRAVVITLLAAVGIGVAVWCLISLAATLAGSLVNAGLIH
jgi:hypothetical protein